MLTSYRKDDVDIDEEFHKVASLFDKGRKKQLNSYLKKLEYFIALRGLSEEQFCALLDFFVGNEIDNELRNNIIYCLVPRSVIPNQQVHKAVMWVLRNAITNSAAVVQFLDWIKAVTKFKLVDYTFMRKYYDIFIKIMHTEALVPGLCSILNLLTDSSVVTSSNVYLLNRAFQTLSRNGNIKKLLQHMASINPNLVPEAFHNAPKAGDNKSLSGIETVMKKTALRLQIDWKSKDRIFLPNAPLLKTPGETDRDMPEVKNMLDLGKNICLGKDLPENHLNLLSSQEGIMAVVALGPTTKFLAELKKKLESEPDSIIEAVVSLQSLLKRGLPPVFDYLSQFLTSWDGFYKEHLVYGLLPWLRFDSLHELNENILTPLARVCVTSSDDVKVKIINALSELTINLITVELHKENYGDDTEPQWMADSGEETIEALIGVITSLINTGILLEGVNSNALLVHSLNFYCKLARLYMEGHLHCFYAMPESITFSALCSLDPTLLNETCSIFTMYRKEIIPFIEQNGSTDVYAQELAMIEGVADNIYDYIWAPESGVQMSQVHHNSVYSRTIASGGVGRKHLALQILCKAVCTKLKQDPSKLASSDLLRIFSVCASDVSDFITNQERNHMD